MHLHFIYISMGLKLDITEAKLDEDNLPWKTLILRETSAPMGGSLEIVGHAILTPLS